MARKRSKVEGERRTKNRATVSREATMETQAPSSNPAEVDEFESVPKKILAKNASAFIEYAGKKGVKCLRDEFRKLRAYTPPGKTEVARLPVNEKRNRFNDLCVLDDTRVKLKGADNDYINASRVTCGRRTYICAQGPMPETVVHFWQMIMQEEIKIVVQLCNFIEDGREKCAEYFPRRKGVKKRHGTITITCKDAVAQGKQLDKVTITTLDVAGDGKKLLLYHLLYEGWKDHLVPDELCVALALHSKVKELVAADPSPILVHCSAGIGRTGSFVAIDVTRSMAVQQSLALDDMLKKLRDQRMHCVQNELQYLFVARSFIEGLAERKIIKDEFAKFNADYDGLITRKRKELAEKRRKTTAASVDDAGGGE